MAKLQRSAISKVKFVTQIHQGEKLVIYKSFIINVIH